MSDESRSAKPGLLDRTAVVVTIIVGVVTIIGGVSAWLFRDKESATDRYRDDLRTEVCTGGLARAEAVGQPSRYAGSNGRIDKQAWLGAMDRGRTHMTEGLRAIEELEPPDDLRSERDAVRQSLDELIAVWGEYRTYTAGLAASRLTVFDYPGAMWTGRLTDANSAVEGSLSRLLGEPVREACSGTTPTSAG